MVTGSYGLFKGLWLQARTFLRGQKFLPLNVILNMSDRGDFLIKGSGAEPSGLTTCKHKQWNFTAAGPVICYSTRPNLTGKRFNLK